MSFNDEHRGDHHATATESSHPAADEDKELLEQLNCELRDLICSRMVLDSGQRLQPHGLTLEQMRHVMKS